MERAGALGTGGRVLGGDVERDERLRGGFERLVRLRGEEAAGERRGDAAGPGHGGEQRMAVRDREDLLAVGDVVDRPGDGGNEPELQPGLARELGGLEPTRHRLDAAHLGVGAHERRHLAGVAAQHGRRRTSSRIRRAVSVRYAVAPTPTGSSTTGIPRALAARPAISIASIQCSESVPMLSTSADASPTISSTSCGACAMTGSAPIASVAFAVSFMTT